MTLRSCRECALRRGDRFALREILHDGLRTLRNFELRVSRRADLPASCGISHAGWRAHTALNCAFRAELRALRNFELHFLSFMQALRQTDAARNSS